MPSATEAMKSPFWTSVYFSFITFSTIGYGDYYPVTVEGRLITMMAAIWGAILLALFVTVVTEIFNLHEFEERAITHVDASR